MKRLNPVFSSLSLVASALLLALLGILLWRSGGQAFSPGRLSAKSRPAQSLAESEALAEPVLQAGLRSHADFERECALCHKPLETTQDVLCLACHRSVREQIETGAGTHSLIKDVSQCMQCHPEHRGAEFDPTGFAYPQFDHGKADFSLGWHQFDYQAQVMECGDCHRTQGDFSVAPEDCADCHAGEDAGFMQEHLRDFGQDCTACHDGYDRMIDFEHQATRFPLEGRHTQVKCTDCHTATSAASASQAADTAVVSFSGTPLDCQGCHQEPQQHLGVFQGDCGECHDPGGWAPARLDGVPFEHAASSGFSLDRHRQGWEGSPLTCSDCHLPDLGGFEQQTCTDCHSQGDERAAFMQEHQAQYGTDCLQCHDGSDRMSGFDHAQVFTLDGAHAAAECLDCHTGFTFRGTPSACVDCHAEPEIHAGFFGLACESCHTTQAWAPASLRVHRFPLDHGSDATLECQTCHLDRYTEYTCYGCHEHEAQQTAEEHQEAGIGQDRLPACAECHPDGVETDIR